MNEGIATYGEFLLGFTNDEKNLTLTPSRAGRGTGVAESNLFPSRQGTDRREMLRRDAAALDEHAALGADAHAIDVGAIEFGRAERLIDGRDT